MKAPRASQHLSAPPAPCQLRGRFPACLVGAGARLHRTHREGFGPWWFGNSLAGRFDLAEPHGTCYTAESEIVTLLETWAGISRIPRLDLDHRVISAVRVDREVTIADMTSNAAIGFGVTAEIHTTIDYDLTQRWATALRSAGYDGIRYWARHEVGRTAACVAVFDTAGAHAEDDAYVVETTEPLTGRAALWDELRQQTGIAVIDIPNSM